MTSDEATRTKDHALKESLASGGPVGVISAECYTRANNRLISLYLFATLWPLVIYGMFKVNFHNAWAAFAVGIVGNLVAAAIAALGPSMLRRWRN